MCARRAIIALQPDHGRAWKVVLEAQDVVDLGTAPAIDRLIVVADAAQVLVRLRQKPQPEILRDVGVLILVHQHVAKAPLVLRQDVGMLAPEAQAFEQQVAEIGGVQRFQTSPGRRCRACRPSVGEGAGFTRRDLTGPEAAVLPAVDHGGELAGRPAFLVDILGRDHLLHQPDLVVGAEDREVGAQIDEFRVPPQDLGADGMERPEPLHALGHRPDEGSDPFAHLPGGLVGEGHRQDVEGTRLAGGDQMGDAGRQNPRLAGAGASQHEHRPLGRFDGRALFGIEARQIRRLRRDGRARTGARAIGNPGCG